VGDVALFVEPGLALRVHKNSKKIKKGVDNDTISCYNGITKGTEDKTMDIVKTIREIMDKSSPKITLQTLADNLGYKTTSGVSERLRGKSMKVDTAVSILNALGYEVIIQPKTSRPAKDGCYKLTESE
jgi:hypothetical protein